MSIPELSKPTREAIAFSFVARAFRENKGALRGLVPLFAAIFRARNGQLFEPAAIAADINKSFDLNVSPLVVESLIPALLEEGMLKSFATVGPSAGLFRCTAPEETDETSEVAEEVQRVFAAFRAHARGKLESHKLDCTDEELDTHLLDALTTAEFLHISLRKDVSRFKGRTLSLKADETVDRGLVKQQAVNYLCAEFIQLSISKQSADFEALVQASWGALISEVVLAIQRPDQNAHLTDLTVYIDGPLLLDALDIGEESSALYARDFMALLIKSGAKSATFLHTIEEMQGVIQTPLSLLDQGYPASGPIVQRIGRNKEHLTHVRAVLASLRRRVEELGVSVVPEEEFLETHRMPYFVPDDIDRLRIWIAGDHIHEHVQRDLRDAKSIAYTMRMRGGITPHSVSDARCIFVTRNPGLIKATQTFLEHKKMLPEFSAPVCVSDQQLAGVLWFCTGGGGESLTRLKLASNCAVAVLPRTELVSTMAQHLLDQAPERSREFEALMRHDRAAMCLMQETLGVASLATPDDVERVLEAMRSQVSAEERTQYEALLEAQRRELEQHHRLEIAERERRIEELDTRFGTFTQEQTQLSAQQLMAAQDAAESARNRQDKIDVLESDLSTRASAERRAIAALDQQLQGILRRVTSRLQFELILLYFLSVFSLSVLAMTPLLGLVLAAMVATLGFWKLPNMLFSPIVARAVRTERRRFQDRNKELLASLGADVVGDEKALIIKQ